MHHQGDIWVAELNVKTVDSNGNAITALVVIVDAQTGKEEKSLVTKNDGSYTDAGWFTPFRTYNIYGFVGDEMVGMSTVTLAKGTNNILITLQRTGK